MLYRTPRVSPLGQLRALLARLAGALAEARNTRADTAYLDRLSTRELSELGLDRVRYRDETHYR